MRIALQPRRRRGQAGAALIEFALGAIAFFYFMFGVIELARAVYLWNTIAAITQRAAHAAAVADFSNSAAIATLRDRAAFKSATSSLPLAPDIDGSYLTISYLRRDGSAATSAICPAENIRNCAQDRNACIQLVRVRFCEPGTDCNAVPFRPLLAGLFPAFVMHYPTFESVVPAGSLGYQPGVSGSC